jgi:hypothetical protein
MFCKLAIWLCSIFVSIWTVVPGQSQNLQDELDRQISKYSVHFQLLGCDIVINNGIVVVFSGGIGRWTEGRSGSL